MKPRQMMFEEREKETEARHWYAAVRTSNVKRQRNQRENGNRGKRVDRGVGLEKVGCQTSRAVA